MFAAATAVLVAIAVGLAAYSGIGTSTLLAIVVGAVAAVSSLLSAYVETKGRKEEASLARQQELADRWDKAREQHARDFQSRIYAPLKGLTVTYGRQVGDEHERVLTVPNIVETGYANPDGVEGVRPEDLPNWEDAKTHLDADPRIQVSWGALEELVRERNVLVGNIKDRLSKLIDERLSRVDGQSLARGPASVTPGVGYYQFTTMYSSLHNHLQMGNSTVPLESKVNGERNYIKEVDRANVYYDLPTSLKIDMTPVSAATTTILLDPDLQSAFGRLPQLDARISDAMSQLTVSLRRFSNEVLARNEQPGQCDTCRSLKETVLKSEGQD